MRYTQRRFQCRLTNSFAGSCMIALVRLAVSIILKSNQSKSRLAIIFLAVLSCIIPSSKCIAQEAYPCSLYAHGYEHWFNQQLIWWIQYIWTLRRVWQGSPMLYQITAQESLLDSCCAYLTCMVKSCSSFDVICDMALLVYPCPIMYRVHVQQCTLHVHKMRHDGQFQEFNHANTHLLD